MRDGSFEGIIEGACCWGWMLSRRQASSTRKEHSGHLRHRMVATEMSGECEDMEYERSKHSPRSSSTQHAERIPRKNPAPYLVQLAE